MTTPGLPHGRPGARHPNHAHAPGGARSVGIERTGRADLQHCVPSDDAVFDGQACAVFKAAFCAYVADQSGDHVAWDQHDLSPSLVPADLAELLVVIDPGDRAIGLPGIDNRVSV